MRPASTVNDLSSALGVPAPQDHQDHDGNRRDGDDHAVARRRQRRADRRRARPRASSRSSTLPTRTTSPRSTRTIDGRSRAAAPGRDDHGPRRPRQDDAPRRDSRDLRRRDRGGRDHAAHRCVPGRPRRPQDHVPRHARVTRRSPRCARAAQRSRTSPCSSSPPTTASCRRRRSRSRHARAAGVPIVVAVNKIDVADADPTRVRSELSPRACSRRSGVGRRSSRTSPRRQGENLDDLLEKVLARRRCRARADGKPDAPRPPGRSSSRGSTSAAGPVATMLVHRGTLHVGDAVVAGDAWGKVRALYNFRGDKVKEARPGTRSRSSASTSRRPPASSAAWSRTSGVRAISRAHAASGCGASSSRRRRSAASRSRTSSSRSRAGAVQDLNLVLKGDVRRLGRGMRSRSSRRSSTPRCASTSSTRASAASPRTTSCSRPPRARPSSASTSARTPKRARLPSARASRSARTASSTS